MVFSSTLFLFMFLPVTLFVYYLLRGAARNYWLLIVSLVFFAWSQPNYLWVILLNIVVNYSCAMLIDKLEKNRRFFMLLAVVANIGILFYFKYFDFLLESLNHLLGSSFKLHEIVLPIGISFFTFQGLSYVIDVYRKDVPVQKNPFKVALYIVLFPQLIAGPIVRYTDVVAEIDRRTVTMDDFAMGIERFIIGMGKKAIFANTMAATADAIWANGAGNPWTIAWVGSIAYTLQIYFDFSGYSDMAIGLGRMFGFRFNENFDLPYISKSITEFWRRWHISLSSWFRDYVYIPLGGNRKRVYFNLAVVFLLTGIWHGAAWHYILWGVWNGFFILAERFLKNKRPNKMEQKEPVWKIVCSKLYTLLVVNLGWVLFRAPNTKEAIKYGMTMFGLRKAENIGFTLGWYLDDWTLLIMVLAILFASSLPGKAASFLKKHIHENVWLVAKYILLLAVLYMAMLRIVSGTYNPFIYFQF